MTFDTRDVDEFYYGGFFYLDHRPTRHRIRWDEDNVTPTRLDKMWAELRYRVEAVP